MSDAAQENAHDHAHTSAMLFLSDFGIESLDFLQLQARVARGVGPPWLRLEVFESSLPDCFPPYL